VRYFRVVPLLLLFLFVSYAVASVIRVPSDYPTIQEALNHANPYDTVLVASGIYYENIVWPQVNGIRLVGSGIGSSIIDGSFSGSVITLSSSEIDTSTIIEGFTIQNGSSDWMGGGIFADSSSPTIQNNEIRSCTAKIGGGIAFYSHYSLPIHPVILYNEILGNHADSLGGGIFVSGGISSNVVIVGNNVHDNSAWWGGGIMCKRHGSMIIANSVYENEAEVGAGIYSHGSILVQANTVKENVASKKGGGIYLYTSSVVGNLITSNVSDSVGGGLYCFTGYVIGNTIFENTAPTGGGLYSVYASIVSNEISKNVADSGGGVYIKDAQLERNRIIKNWAQFKGGGVYAVGGAAPNYNVISWNYADKGAGIYTVGHVDNFYNTVVSNFGSAYWIFDDYPMTRYSAIVDNGPYVFDTASFICMVDFCNIYFNPKVEGEFWMINLSESPQSAPLCFFWFTDPDEVDERIYDDEESGGTSGEVAFTLWDDYPSGAPGEPLEVYTLEVYRDSLYSVPFTDTARVGDTLYIELVGVPRNENLVDYALIRLTSSYDTVGIFAGLIEIDTTSEVFRGFVIVDTASNDLFNRIEAGEWIAVSSLVDPSLSDTLISEPPYPCGDSNGNGEVDVGDLTYLANYLFGGGPPPSPFMRADSNGDCFINVGDLVYLAGYIYLGGSEPHCCLERW
jgi:hypothetical protein